MAAGQGFRPPLQEYSVCVHSGSSTAAAAAAPSGGGRAGGGKGGAATAEHKASLQRLVIALGGRLAQPRTCTVCVICGKGRPPSGLARGAAAVTEEWLLQAAETFDAPSVEAYSTV